MVLSLQSDLAHLALFAKGRKRLENDNSSAHELLELISLYQIGSTTLNCLCGKSMTILSVEVQHNPSETLSRALNCAYLLEDINATLLDEARQITLSEREEIEGLLTLLKKLISEIHTPNQNPLLVLIESYEIGATELNSLWFKSELLIQDERHRMSDKNFSVAMKCIHGIGEINATILGEDRPASQDEQAAIEIELKLLKKLIPTGLRL